MTGPAEPVPLAEVARMMSRGAGTAMELPVTFAVLRFHAGRAWVAPLGTNLGRTAGQGSHPGAPWVEVRADG